MQPNEMPNGAATPAPATAAEAPVEAKPQGFPLNGHFGEFGGQHVPEALLPTLQQLETALIDSLKDIRFQRDLRGLWGDYGGRPTALYFARRLSQSAGGARIYLKREDLLQGGAHLMNSALGQALLAKKMGKKRLITESASGDQGVVAAMAAAMTGLALEVYMGQRDFERQRRNVYRMKLLGAKVRVIQAGQGELPDAIAEVMRDWTAQKESTHYLISSAVGPHPYPWMVREFQRVIGDEIKGQILRKERRMPDALLAALGAGGCAIGAFHPFVSEEFVHLITVEPGGSGGEGESTFGQARAGIFQGMKSLLLQDEQGRPRARRSLAAGLSYPAMGPEHAYLRAQGREERVVVNDQQALDGFRRLAQAEGIFTSMESAHAVYAALEWARKLGSDGLLVVILSGQSEKDLEAIQRMTSPPPQPQPGAQEPRREPMPPAS